MREYGTITGVKGIFASHCVDIKVTLTLLCCIRSSSDVCIVNLHENLRYFQEQLDQPEQSWISSFGMKYSRVAGFCPRDSRPMVLHIAYR